MGGAWTINVGGRLYGPFSSERMRSFASEGRLAPTSLVALENATDWREARNEPQFADLFAPIPTQAPAPAMERPLQQTSPAPAPAQMAAAHPRPLNGVAADVQRTQFAVVTDMKSRGGASFEHAIAALGPSYQLLPNVWIVSSDQTVSAVRNRLIQELGKSDSLFVVDASRGKAAWFNFGPDADAHIRRVWNKTA